VNVTHEFSVGIPGGFWKGGVLVREAQLRPLNGQDEAFLLDTQESLSAAARTTALLSRCVLRLGTDADVTPDAVRSLTVGDREALLLHLWRITFGNRLPCVLACPLDGCGEKMDLELSVTDLLLPPYPEPRQRYEFAFDHRETRYHMRFRLPTGSDQELVAERARISSAEAEKQLLRACVEEICTESGPVDDWRPEIEEFLDRKMPELDPQADTVLRLQCPSCGGAFVAQFDAASFLFQEVKARLPHLYREVHRIAVSYHWSEAEILGMTPEKRSVYLNLLTGEGTLG